MEDGVKAVEDERRSVETTMEEGDGAQLLDSVDGGDDGSVERPTDAEENEVFEEAMDAESFQTLHHLSASSGSLDFASKGVEFFEDEKFEESDDKGLASSGAEESGESGEAQGSDLGPEVQTAVVSEAFDDQNDNLVNDQIPEDDTVASAEKSGNDSSSDCAIEEVEADSMIGEGVKDEEEFLNIMGKSSSVIEGGGERVSEHDEEELLEEKSRNGEFNGVESDGSPLAANGEAENGVSYHAESEELVVSDDGVGAESEELVVSEDGVVEEYSECEEKEFVGEESRNAELNGMNSNGSSLTDIENSTSRESPEVEFEEHTHHEDGSLKERDVSVNLDVPSNKSHPSEDLFDCREKESVSDKSVNGVKPKAQNGESHDTGFKEQVIHEDVVLKQLEVSVGLVVSADDAHPSQDLSDFNGKEEVMSEKSTNGELNVVNSDGSAFNEHLENGFLKNQEVSVGFSVPSDSSYLSRELSETASAGESAAEEGISTRSHIKGGIKEPLKQNEAQIGIKFERESVLVEDISDSSSTDDDDIRAHSQPAQSATSRPVGLRSSAPFLEPLRNSTLPSPAGLGSSAPLLEPTHRSLPQLRANSSVPQRQSNTFDELVNDDAEEEDETRQKLQMIRVKFLRLAHRLGQTPHNIVVAQVLYRLGLAEQLRKNTNRPGVFSFDRASVLAEQLETAGQEPLDFSCTIMVIGKTGVGKSATINSIFDEVKFRTDTFNSSTQKAQDIVGTVQGIKVRVIDTPGLSASSLDHLHNVKILRSVKKFIGKSPPDIVLYFDRLDVQSRDYGDIPLLRTITETFGTSIWFNAIVVLTHAASAPPEGPNGTALSYEMFVTQRSHVVQQAIHRATGDMRLMNPVSLVENHSACRMNRAGQRVLPNGQIWKPQLLLLSFASKILAEANMLLKLQDSPPGKPFGSRARVAPLPFFLSSLLQSRPQLKLPEEQFSDDDMDEDLDEASDSDGGSDYDELPPFKRLSKAELNKLSKAQKKAYFEEIDYREKLFFRKQLKEEKKRRKLLKKMAAEPKDLPDKHNGDNFEDESSGPASVPIPMPDYTLPASFDSDNPSHRYRFLDSSNQWLVRPVLDSQGWDHDVGYEGLNIERLFAIKDKIPVSVSGQLTKDKKECTLQMELASSIKHSEGSATTLGLDMQTAGKDMAYTLRSETRFKSLRRNNTVAGISATMLGDTVSAGMKFEDQLIVSKTLRLLMAGGAMTSRNDVAYGGRLEATLRNKDYPLGRMLTTLALSVVDWHGDLALGCNFQSQLPLGRATNLVGHANWSNKGSGQVGIRFNSSEHLQIALLALVPIFRSMKKMLSNSSQPM